MKKKKEPSNRQSSLRFHRNTDLAMETKIVNRQLICLLTCTLLAAGLRLWKLGEWSLWEDEILTTLDAQKFPDVFPINPISYIFVKLSIFLFGSSEWGVRFIPCLIGIITVPVLYFLVRSMYNSRVALLTAIFTGLSPWHLFWSQNARSYIFTFLFASISAFTFYLALEKDSITLLIASLISTAMLTMSHLLSAMLVFALAGYVLILWLLPIEKPPGLRMRNLAVFFVPFIAAATVLFVPGIFQYLTSGWGHNVWSRSPIYVAFTLIYELTIPVFIVALLSAVGAGMQVSRCAGVQGSEGAGERGSKGTGEQRSNKKTRKRENGKTRVKSDKVKSEKISVRFAREKEPPSIHSLTNTHHSSRNTQSSIINHQSRDRRSIFLACYAGIPLVLFLISSTFMNVAGYYMFFTVPAYLTLASVGIIKSDVTSHRLHMKIGLFLIIVLTLFSRDYLYFRAENGGRPRWRKAFDTVKQEMSPTDLVVIPIPKIAEYYLPSAESIKLKEVMKNPDKFEARLQSTKRDAWFVIDYPTIRIVDQDQQFYTWLKSKARFIKRYGCYARVMDRSIVIYKLSQP